MPPLSPTRILSLGDVPPRSGVLRRPAIEAVEAWLATRGRHASLWVHGPAGSGRTTAVAAAIRQSAPPAFAVKRVACFPGMCFEEILEHASILLQQAGSNSLSAVLRQRAFARSKVAVLLDAMRQTPIMLWIDDVDHVLEDVGGSDAFLKGVKDLDGAAGRVIVTAVKGPPAELESCFDAVSVPWHDSPLALRWGQPDAATPEESARLVLEHLLSELSEGAAAVLHASAALPPEPSRQALRETAAALHVELVLRNPCDDPPLLELERLGLANLSAVPGEVDPASGPPLSVPAPVRSFVANKLRTEEPETWKAIQTALGAYSLRIATRNTDLWHYVGGWRAFFEAGRHDAAYEVQKVFVEELIQHGSLDMARYVLLETVRTTTGLRRAVALGNLAIIHKNCGQLERALEIYAKVEEEFTSLGDQLNLARVLHQIGNTQYVMCNYDAAVDSYERSLEISTALGDHSVAAATRIQVANVYYMRGDRDRALGQYLETLDDARVAQDLGLTAAVELQIGQIHLLEKRYLEAEAHLKEAEASARSSGDLRSLIKVLEALGMVARERCEYDAARAIYDDAIAMARALGDAVEVSAGLVLAGDLEQTRVQLAEAGRCYVRAQDGIAKLRKDNPSDARAVVGVIEERIEALRQTLGPELFAKVEVSARAGKLPG